MPGKFQKSLIRLIRVQTFWVRQ